MKFDIKALVDEVFSKAPGTTKAVDLKEELYQNLCDRYDELIRSGKSDTEAMDSVKTAIGDFTPVIDALENDDAKRPSTNDNTIDDDSAAKEQSTQSGSENTQKPTTEPVNVFNGGSGQNSGTYNGYQGERRGKQPPKHKMSGTAKGFLIAGCILGGLVLIAFIVGVTALITGMIVGGNAVTNIAGYSYPDSENYTRAIVDAGGYTSGVSYPAETVKNIDLDWIAGDVEVKFADQEKITIKEESDKTLYDENVMCVRFENGTLDVKYCKPMTFWQLTKITDIGKKLTVTIPNNIALSINGIHVNTISANAAIDMSGSNSGTAVGMISADMVSGVIKVIGDSKVTVADIETVSGNIHVKEVIGECYVSTVSGVVNVENCVNLAKTELSSISGKIHASECGTDYLKFSTTSGTVSYSGSASIIDGDTVSGLVTIYIPDAEGIDVETTSGNIGLTLFECAGFTADLDSVSGELTSSFATVKTDGKYVYGDGTCRIEADTVSGDLYISNQSIN